MKFHEVPLAALVFIMFVGPEMGRGAVQLLGGGAAGVLRQHAVRGSRGRGLLCRGQAGLLCADSEINMLCR